MLAMDQLTDMIDAIEAATHDPASSLHFTPVAVRARIGGWSPQRQRRFVATLAAVGSAERAAAMVGMTEQTAGRLRRRPDGASFAAACSAAYTFAKQLRRARAAKEGSKGSVRQAPIFSLWGSSLSSNAEPFAGRR